MLSPDCVAWLNATAAIDRAGNTYRQDPTNYVVLRQVQCYRLFRLLGLNHVLDETVALLPVAPRLLAARLKRLPTIVRKLERQPGMQLSRMVDIIGFRLVCDTPNAAKDTAQLLTNSALYRRTQDYCDQPQASGYRAYHVLLRDTQEVPSGGHRIAVHFEVQVRSYFQHLWALVSESFGEQVKEGAGPEHVRKYLLDLSDAIRKREENNCDEVQTSLPMSSKARGIVVVRMSNKGQDKQMLAFGDDYSASTRQLLNWEESLADGAEGTLLLVGTGDVKNIGRTHAAFLGMKSIPLPDWMPRLS